MAPSSSEQDISNNSSFVGDRSAETMRTKVVNVRVKYLRPKFNNLKEWCSSPKNVYIGRRGVVFVNGKRFPAKDSLLANPFKLNKAKTNRGDVMKKYRRYALGKNERKCRIPRGHSSIARKDAWVLVLPGSLSRRHTARIGGWR